MANPDLKGHKLLITQPRPFPTKFIKHIQEKYPGLEVQYHQLKDWNDTDFPTSYYDNVTALCTSVVFPTREQAPKLQLVQLSSAGANHLHDNALYEKTDISFCTANGVHPPQIAEWVISTWLAFQHHIPRYLDFMKVGEWEATPYEEDVEDSVGLRMGILGYGAIGRQCARLAKAMAMDVVAYTHRERSTPESRRDDSYCVPGTGDPEGLLPSQWFHGASKEAVNDFISQDLDILVICLPLTQITRGIIAAEQFEIMSKKKTFLSNIGRGPHVNTADLIKALESGQIRGAALDVTDPEPLPQDHPLWKAPNLIITPHSSGNSTHYTERVLAILEHNLTCIAEGKPHINKVDRKLAY
ncbi:2-hydroxyacid dehydrogenase [Phlyctema vagabunda]|uniref:2-hydroxyacid dehydrogenase n=1 Tax=Phlyctema vagabunda TaxID=108571 RepID=A0ABR4PSY1_9HELO